MRVELTEPQVRLLISGAALLDAEMGEAIEDGFYTERDRLTLDRASRRLWAALGQDPPPPLDPGKMVSPFDLNRHSADSGGASE